MAYTPLTKRVRDRMAEINGTAQQTPAATPQQFEKAVHALEQKKPPAEPFEWATPERIRDAARQARPATKRTSYGMTNAQIIRALRKGKK